MNQQQSFSYKEIILELLETIWIHHSGFLERITKQNGVNFYYMKNMIILEGNSNQCDNAAQRIYQKVYEDFIMQIEQFYNEEEIQPFYQLLQQHQYRELCLNNQGFWIYSQQSLMKQFQNMKQRGYQSNYPILPQHYIVIWFPRTNMLYIQQCIYNMIGYQYKQQSLQEKFKFNKQFTITALEAISIYLILDVQDLMDEFQLIIELNQISNQYFLIIKANDIVSFENTFMIIENHLIHTSFWPITQLEMKLSSNDLLYLEKTIDDQVQTTSRIKIYLYEEVLYESQRLDKIFNINLNLTQIERSYSDQIFVFADQDKQFEITNKIIQILRKPKQNIRVNQEDKLQKQQFHYKDTQNEKMKRNKKFKNQQKPYPYQNKQKKSKQDQYNFYDFQQFELKQYNQFKQYPKEIQINQTKSNYELNDQLDLQPLKNYKQVLNDERVKQNRQKQNQQINYKQPNLNQNIQIDIPFNILNDLNLANIKQFQNNENNFYYYYQQPQEEEKTSQLLQVEDLNQSIKCQVIKLELFQYQIMYNQSNVQNNRQINFTELQKSFEEYKNIYYHLQHEIILEFDQDSIKMNIKCKLQDEINQIKYIFHKYFLQQMYFVAQYSTQTLNLIDNLKQNCRVQYFLTKTELQGFINEQQFKEIEQIEQIDDGLQIVIKIDNYSYRHHQFLKSKFNDFIIEQQSINQSSSILDISKQVINNTKIIIISEDQLKYLQQEFPDLEAWKMRKFKEYFKMAFYFVQIEDIEEMYKQAKVEFKKMNEIYVKNQVQMKKQKNNKGWMMKIKKEEDYQASKLYCYNMMEMFNIELLNDINDIQMNIQEYEKYEDDQNQSMYYEAIIELDDIELNPEEDNIEYLLFESDFKFQPRIKKSREDLPYGKYITLWIRNQNSNQLQLIQKNQILPRGYIYKK